MMSKIFIITAVTLLFCSCSQKISKYQVGDEYYIRSAIYWKIYFDGSKDEAKNAIKSLENELFRLENKLDPSFPIKEEKLLISLRAMDLYCFISEYEYCQYYLEISKSLIEQGIESISIDHITNSQVLFEILTQMNGSSIPAWKFK